MTGKPEQRYSNSAFIYNLINWCTYLLYRFIKLLYSDKAVGKPVSPVLITGMFRSGTTITSRIVRDLGFSAGPEDHLLKAQGSRKWLNPDGFLENHFFMELSMYLFFKTNSWGDLPPSKKQVEDVRLDRDDDNKMVYFSLMKIHDDRISNFKKLKVQLRGSASDPKKYLNRFFASPSFIKNPHFAVLFPYFKKLFPDSIVLVVFRDPAAAVKSAKKVTPFADYKLYELYYNELRSEFEKGNKKIIFFSYDNLVAQPELSVRQLAGTLAIEPLPSFSLSYIRKKDSGNVGSDDVPASTKALFDFMLSNCINK